MRFARMIDECSEDSKRWWPQAQKLDTQVLCMAGEVGEVANIVKKVIRGSMTIEQAMDEDFMKDQGKDTLQEEVIDVLFYLVNLMSLPEFDNVDWAELWYTKRQHNEERFGGPCV